MSAVNLCERCDSLMLGKAVATLRVWDSPHATEKTQELCPACLKDFYDFMHSGSPRNGSVFREPYSEDTESSPVSTPKELS